MESKAYDPQPTKNSSFKIPSLPDELIIEILLRLPVKSLLQFKCVSKFWLALISSPEFVKTHLSISANNDEGYPHHRLMLKLSYPRYNLMDCSVSSLLYDSVAARAVDLDYPMIDPRGHEFICVLGSVNGLFCFSIPIPGDFIIWNPSIRKFKKLPNPKRECCYMYGFGYDELHEDYKVVSVCSSNEVNIYGLNSDSWRRNIDDDFPSWRRLDKSEGIFVNGKLHWANNTSENNRSYISWSIICIGLADGKWGKMELPCFREKDSDDIMPCISMVGSDLCVSCNSESSHTDVWIMKEYGVKESWTKMFTIKRPHNVYLVSPFFCTSDKSEFLFKFGPACVIYNQKNDSIRYQEVTNSAIFRDAKIYVESLVWPFCEKEPSMRRLPGMKKLR
ncbi:F-box/kelch-repeat protein At3g23880-like [Lycium barbarum]|uniref:F-box/kelch-repeat protein At3g23880-like n=1 Tax=Lycium barbarum TaxID=112863 RepID=UPI00293F1ED1|nr:F-box/kelch-repeat protein At3g23880-like [Lycium barbarum]